MVQAIESRAFRDSGTPRLVLQKKKGIEKVLLKAPDFRQGLWSHARGPVWCLAALLRGVICGSPRQSSPPWLLSLSLPRFCPIYLPSVIPVNS